MKYLKRLLFRIFIFFFGHKEKGLAGATTRTLRNPYFKIRPVIHSIISITPGKHHAWVESSVGRIRKPLESIRCLSPDNKLFSCVTI